MSGGGISVMVRTCLAWLFFWLALPTVGIAADSLTVATIEREPFSYRQDGVWTGFSIELLEAIGARLEWDLAFIETQTFPEMLDTVSSLRADIAAANISITFARESTLDFSQPIFDAGLIILAPVTGGANIFSVLFSRDLLLWVGGAILLLLAAGALIWRIETVADGKKDTDYDDGKIGGVGEGIWWAVNVVTQAGFEIPSPKKRAGRLLAFALILTGLFAVSAFVAQITASLTVSELTSQVSDLSDLRGRRVGTTVGSTSAAHLDEQAIRYTGYASLDDMFGALEEGALDALVHDAPILAYYARQNEEARYQLVGRVFKREQYAFALFEGHRVKEELNRALLQLREDGTYDDLVARYFGADY